MRLASVRSKVESLGDLMTELLKRPSLARRFFQAVRRRLRASLSEVTGRNSLQSVKYCTAPCQEVPKRPSLARSIFDKACTCEIHPNNRAERSGAPYRTIAFGLSPATRIALSSRRSTTSCLSTFIAQCSLRITWTTKFSINCSALLHLHVCMSHCLKIVAIGLVA